MEKKAKGIPAVTFTEGLSRTQNRLGSVTSQHEGAFSDDPQSYMRKLLGRNNSISKAVQKTLQDTVNLDVLMHVKQRFESADKDGSGELSQDEFVVAFDGILTTSDGSGPEALARLFLRIDVNCDGTVDWDEFSQYMLLENQGSAKLRDFESLTMIDVPQRPENKDSLLHKDVITSITTFPEGIHGNRYVTTGRDGTVKIWNATDLSHIRTVSLGNSILTGAKQLPLSQKIAVTTFARAMRVYDMQTWELCGSISEIDYAPLNLDAWVPANRRDHELVVMGDVGGWVRLYDLRVNPLEDKKSEDRYIGLPIWRQALHTDWVTCVRFISDLNAVISTSLDGTLAMVDVEERVPLKRLEGHTKGVHSCDWSAMYKFIASCGQDRKLILWNPFSQKPLATLSGHTCTVLDVKINERNNQMLTLGVDKTIKVWDIRNHRCIQTVQDKEFYKTEDIISCMALDVRRRCLLTSNMQVKRWPLKQTGGGAKGHHMPVMRVLFNANFGEIVTADQGGAVCVWHLATGKLRFKFTNSHNGHPITAMTFDTSKRRLITGKAGSDDGSVKMWNFSSGKCLRVLSEGDGREVTHILPARSALTKLFLVCGWNKKVTFYEDADGETVGAFRVMVGHEADILSMTIMAGASVLATCSEDGDIITWNIDSGMLKRKIAAPNRDQLPQGERSVDCITFLNGSRLKQVLLTAGADRYLRFWNSNSGTLLCEVFSGHKSSESIVALALTSNNKMLATADSAGYIKVWDMSEFTGEAPAPGSGARVVQRCTWRGHQHSVTALDWAEVPEGFFLLSACLHPAVRIWSETGAPVGVFGTGEPWELDDPTTWLGTHPIPFQEQEGIDMARSAHPTSTTSSSRPGSPKRPATASHSRSNLGAPEAASTAEASLAQPSITGDLQLDWSHLSNGTDDEQYSSSGSSEGDNDVPEGLWLDGWERSKVRPAGPPRSRRLGASLLMAARNSSVTASVTGSTARRHPPGDHGSQSRTGSVASLGSSRVASRTSSGWTH